MNSRAMMGAGFVVALCAGSIIAVAAPPSTARTAPSARHAAPTTAHRAAAAPLSIPAFRRVAGVSETAVTCTSTSACVAVGPTTMVSGNGGVSWSPAAGPIVRGNPRAVACATASVCLAVGSTPAAAGGVWRSVNAGRNFTPVTIPAIGPLSGVACASASNCVASAAAGGALVTSNGGTSWTRYAAPVQTVTCGAGSATKCVGTDHVHMYWSSNTGRTWTAAALAPQPGGMNAPFCATATLCLAGTGTEPNQSGPIVLRSTDAGHHWSVLDVSDTLFEYSFDQVRCQTASRCLGLQLVDEAGQPGLIDLRAAWTPDGGLHWQQTNAPNVYAPTALACTAVRCVAASTDIPHATNVGYGPFATTPDLGADWTNRLVSQVSEGLGIACPDTTHCIQVAQNATSTSSDGGATWKWVNGLGGYDIACTSTTHCFTLLNNNYECGDNCPPYSSYPGHSDIMETNDGGKTYHARVLASGAIAIACPTTTHCFALAGLAPLEVSTSYDWTPTTGWVNRNEYPPYQPPFIAAFSSNPVQCASSTRCYAVGDENADGGAVRTTANAGKTWPKTTAQPTGMKANLVTCVDATHCLVAGRAASGKPRLARTTNGGASWTAVPTPALDAMNTLFCNAAAKCIIATATSVFLSSDGGATWTATTSPTASGGTDARCRASFCVVVGPVTLRTVAPADLPSAPTLTGVRSGNGWVSVAWNPPSSPGSSAISSYTVTTSPGRQTITVPATARRAIVTVPNGTTQTAHVQAVNNLGSGATSAESAAFTPAATTVNVTTAYNANDNTRLLKNATYFGQTALNAQRTSVGILAYLVGLAHAPSMTPVEPPTSTGPNSYTTPWSATDQSVLVSVMRQYGLTPSEAQYFGAQLVGYLLALGGH